MRFHCTSSFKNLDGSRTATLVQLAETPAALLQFGTLTVSGARAKVFKPGKLYQLTIALQEVLEGPKKPAAGREP